MASPLDLPDWEQQTRDDQTTHVYREAGVKALTVTADLSNGLRFVAARSVQIANP